MNEHHLKRLFPNASTSFIKNNSDSHSRLCATEQKPIEGVPLVSPSKRKAKVIHSTERRVKITFTVYSMRPCDWDNYWTKYIQDFLVKCGCLDGDEWHKLTGQVVSEKASSKADERTEIEITLC